MITPYEYERLMNYYSGHPMDWEDLIAVIKGYVMLDEVIGGEK